LSGEAQNLYGDFADNPMFKNMMNNPELQKMQEQMQGQGAVAEELGEEEQVKNNKNIRVNKLNNTLNDIPNIVPKNKTQERLQRKIKVSEAKKAEKVGKVNVNKEE